MIVEFDFHRFRPNFCFVLDFCQTAICPPLVWTILIRWWTYLPLRSKLPHQFKQPIVRQTWNKIRKRKYIPNQLLLPWLLLSIVRFYPFVCFCPLFSPNNNSIYIQRLKDRRNNRIEMLIFGSQGKLINMLKCIK